MKKLAVLCVAACATVLSVGQPARADWKLIGRDHHTGEQFYYDENYTHPSEYNHNDFIARVLKQREGVPVYAVLSCSTDNFALSYHEKTGYGSVAVLKPGSTGLRMVRDQYCHTSDGISIGSAQDWYYLLQSAATYNYWRH